MRLVASDIRKRYSGKEILHGCSYAFPGPGTYVLTGANGCGKSTLLRILALLQEPDGGSVEFFENGVVPGEKTSEQRMKPLSLQHSPTRASDARVLAPDITLRRRITLVLPRIGLFNTSVWKNASYGLAVRGEKGAVAEEKTARALAFVGLDKKRNQKALTLSTGESQRLGIARALAVDPSILFLDEPTASVDEENTRIIESVIRTMKQEAKAMVIMTTHDRAQAERLADRLLLLKNGVIEEVS